MRQSGSNANCELQTEPGLLRAAILYDISTMDVAETTDDYLIPMNVFDRVFETGPASGTSEVVKSLVTEYTVSEDGLTYDFTLRDGIMFPNDSALTACHCTGEPGGKR